MAASSKPRFRRDIEALAKARGWACQKTKAGHFKLTLGPYTVVAPSSPREPGRAMANTLALMKRYENDTR